MESSRQKDNEEKLEQKRIEFLSNQALLDILVGMLDESKDNYKLLMDASPKGDFYEEAMTMSIAKGGCKALESFKQKLLSYLAKGE